jgi:hypothetical protein
MIALLLCIIGAVAAFVAGRRSLAAGCLVVAASGYGYGILRANLITTASHFIFDSAVIGLYLSQFVFRSKARAEGPRHPALNSWAFLLILWPLLLVFMPFQPLLVSIVGLRGNMFLLPAILIGSRLRKDDLTSLAYGFAVLNLIAFSFGIAEYFKGVEPFYPMSSVTNTIYGSYDSGGGYRIPALFTNAHTYAGVMVDTLPFLFGAWVLHTGGKKKLLLILGMAAALVGVVMASTRVGIIEAGLMVVLASLSGKIGALKRWVFVLGIAAAIYAGFNNQRFQRYKELDKDTVTDRIAGSVNRTFFEILFQYPMGNGLGGGGTSIPYFLESRVNRPVTPENEYARILLEQGLIGLALWVGFAGWFLTNRAGFVKDEWFTGRRMAWYLCAFSLVSSVLGTGMLSSVPNAFFFLLTLGWVAVRPVFVPVRQAVVARPLAVPDARGVRV